MMRYKKFWLLFLLSWGGISPVQGKDLTIYAATSTINVIQEIAQRYEKLASLSIRTSFASSSTLAKQIEQGAPAQIFISANPLWMDYLEKRNLLKPQSRFNLFHNRLVLIAPNDSKWAIEWENFDLPKALQGRFSMGDPDHVPAGIYAKEALEYFKWWQVLKTRVIRAHNVRSALIYVERGEVALGIVYQTDAKISEKVQIVGEFPPQSHSPIVYPTALIAEHANPAALPFIRFLQSAEAVAIFQRYGFLVEKSF